MERVEQGKSNREEFMSTQPLIVGMNGQKLENTLPPRIDMLMACLHEFRVLQGMCEKVELREQMIAALREMEFEVAGELACEYGYLEKPKEA